MRQLLIGVVLLLPAWSAADAQENRDIRVRVGLGAQLRPKFVGSDDTRLSPLVKVKVARGAKQFAFSAPDDNPGLAIVTSGGFSFGPSANLEGKRRASDVGAPVDRVSSTIEVGGFAQCEWQDSFRVRTELLKGVNGHEGVVGQISADKIWRDGDRYVFSVGPRVLFSDARYQRAYFGVTPTVSSASGLPAFRPGSGIHAVAVATGATYALNSRLGLFGYGRYERLVGDAAKSPLIRQYGSRDQLSAGVGLNYVFTIHRRPTAQ